MNDENYLIVNDLERFPVSTSWLSRLHGKMPWHFSRRGKIAHLESRLSAIERRALKYIGQGVNIRHIHEMYDEELGAANLVLWNCLNGLRYCGVAYRELTGEKAKLSSPNYHHANNLVESGLLVIEEERSRRGYIPETLTAWWEGP
jgi:hypothetical protein